MTGRIGIFPDVHRSASSVGGPSPRFEPLTSKGRAVQDLPVAVVLADPLGAEVAAWVETAGWQVVGLDGPLRPALVLAGRVLPGLPSVVVVEGSPAIAEVRSAIQAGAVDVIAWPEDRTRLMEIPARLGSAAAPSGGPAVVGLAGVAGGAGTSTLALALGGLLAWSGRRVVVVGDEDLLRLCRCDPWRGPGAAELAVLEPAAAAGEVTQLARSVPGLPALWALGGGALPTAAVRTWPFDAVVLDRRCDAAEADILCGRPDVHLAAARSLPGTLIVNGGGPLDRSSVTALLERPPAGWLPASARVARAGSAGLVPSALPGRWLELLRSAAVHALAARRAL